MGPRSLSRLLVIILGACLAQYCRAGAEADTLFQEAQASYAAAEYDQALSSILQAVDLAPGNSGYQHLLGKCYGRLAERANPLNAYALAKKTRIAFEKAVELDGGNLDALRDLMQYYRQAPWFLGGSRERAEQIQKQLDEMESSPG